jgi:hypothetical protein
MIIKNEDLEAKNARLMEEVKQLKKQNKSLSQKLNTATRKKLALQKESKKKDVTKIELSDEQLKLFSNLFPDIDIRSWLLD